MLSWNSSGFIHNLSAIAMELKGSLRPSGGLLKKLRWKKFYILMSWKHFRLHAKIKLNPSTQKMEDSVPQVKRWATKLHFPYPLPGCCGGHGWLIINFVNFTSGWHCKSIKLDHMAEARTTILAANKREGNLKNWIGVIDYKLHPAFVRLIWGFVGEKKAASVQRVVKIKLCGKEKMGVSVCVLMQSSGWCDFAKMFNRWKFKTRDCWNQ